MNTRAIEMKSSARSSRARNWQRHISRVTLVATGVFAFSATCLADAWEFSPMLRASGGYDDNLNQSDVDKEDGYEYNLSGILGLRRLTETSQVMGQIRTEYVDHAGTTAYDSELNQFFNLSGGYQTNELNRLGLGLRFDRDHTGTTQQADSRDVTDPGGSGGEETDPGQDVDTDVGLVREQIRRERFSIAPSWQHGFSESTSMQLAYSYLDLSYENGAEQDGLTDYTMHTPSLMMMHQLSEQNLLSISLDASYYEADDTGRKYDAYAIRSGFERSFSETISAAVSVGVRQLISEDANGNDDDDFGGLFRVEATKETETGSLAASAERKLAPSGSGSIQQSDVYQLRWRIGMSPRTNVYLNTTYLDSEQNGSSNASTSPDNPKARKYFTIQPGILRRLSETWSLDLHYRFRWQERSGNEGDSDSNGVFLAINYQPLSEFGRR